MSGLLESSQGLGAPNAYGRTGASASRSMPSLGVVYGSAATWTKLSSPLLAAAVATEATAGKGCKSARVADDLLTAVAFLSGTTLMCFLALELLVWLPDKVAACAALRSKLKVISLTSDFVIEGKSWRSLLPKSLTGLFKGFHFKYIFWYIRGSSCLIDRQLAFTKSLEIINTILGSRGLRARLSKHPKEATSSRACLVATCATINNAPK